MVTCLLVKISVLWRNSHSLLPILAIQNLLQTIQTKEVETKCLLVITIIQAPPTVYTTSNAKCAGLAHLGSVLLPPTAVSWTVIHLSELLAFWTYLNVNRALIIKGQIQLLCMEEPWFVDADPILVI